MCVSEFPPTWLIHSQSTPDKQLIVQTKWQGLTLVSLKRVNPFPSSCQAYCSL